jgi:hypothetical protein
METFLQRILEIGQCQLMVTNIDNTSNGRNKIYQLKIIYQTCGPNIPITPNPSKNPSSFPSLKKKVCLIPSKSYFKMQREKFTVCYFQNLGDFYYLQQKHKIFSTWVWSYFLLAQKVSLPNFFNEMFVTEDIWTIFNMFWAAKSESALGISIIGRIFFL